MRTGGPALGTTGSWIESKQTLGGAGPHDAVGSFLDVVDGRRRGEGPLEGPRRGHGRPLRREIEPEEPEGRPDPQGLSALMEGGDPSGAAGVQRIGRTRTPKIRGDSWARSPVRISRSDVPIHTSCPVTATAPTRLAAGVSAPRDRLFEPQLHGKFVQAVHAASPGGNPQASPAVLVQLGHAIRPETLPAHRVVDVGNERTLRGVEGGHAVGLGHEDGPLFPDRDRAFARHPVVAGAGAGTSVTRPSRGSIRQSRPAVVSAHTLVSGSPANSTTE